MIKKIINFGSHWFWATVSLLTILLVVIFDLRIITGSEILQVQYIPDDAYYYLTLARNFSDMGLWTFDSGISTATGFHPLFGYLLSFLYSVLQPTTREFVLYGIIITSLVTFTTSFLAWLLGLRQSKPYFLMFLALLTSSSNYTYNSISSVEWPLGVFFAFLYVLYFYHIYNAPAKYNFFVLFIIGLFGSLARSDFGLLPFSLFIASVIVNHYNENKKSVLASFSGLAGAIFGVLLIFTHNYMFSGHFLQSSAKMKAFWGQIYGVSYWKTIRLVLHIIGANSLILIAILLYVGILACFIIFIKYKERSFSFRKYSGIDSRFLDLILVISAGICLVGYTIIYAHSGGFQPWYSVNLIIPVFILLVITANYLDDAIQRKYRKFVRLGLSIVILGIVVRNMTSIHYDLSRSPWPHQQFMLEAGKYLEQQPLVDGKIASWNAGIIGYYQGGNIVNIDGLVNDDVYAYAINNELPIYITQQNIIYIIDFKNMVDDKTRRLRGGYDDDVFLNALQPIKVFDDGRYSWRYLTLYQLSP